SQREPRDHGSPPADPVREQPAQRSGDGEAHAVEGEDPAGLGRAQSPLAHQVEREERDHEARQPVDDEAPPYRPENAWKSAWRSGEPLADGYAHAGVHARTFAA